MNYQVKYLNRQKHIVMALTLWAGSMAEAITKGVKQLGKFQARQVVRAEVRRAR
jgi:hypothetical protein